MRQFRTILKFELANYYKSKGFVGITLFLVLALAVTMFFPRLRALLADEGSVRTDRPTFLLVTDEENRELGLAFAAAFEDYEVLLSNESDEALREKVRSGEAECVVVLDGLLSYTYYVNNLSLYDQNTTVIDAILLSCYRLAAMNDAGVDLDDAADILSQQISHRTENLGKDQAQNFLYTYLMTMGLYMVIMLYGQMVATGVATEKSTRTMELLITGARPTAMMFGKVLAACCAGFAQLLLIFGTALVCYRLTEHDWAGNSMIASLFNIPTDLLGYMLLFFVLGFFVYAFLYGAVGSTVSKLEEVSTAVMPLSMLFMASFFLVIFSISGGNVDNVAMLICSFIPFTSPMAMFARIAMSVVPTWQIVLSAAILAASTAGIGVLAAKIYRVGVLMYGNRPKLGALLRAIVHT